MFTPFTDSIKELSEEKFSVLEDLKFLFTGRVKMYIFEIQKINLFICRKNEIDLIKAKRTPRVEPPSFKV